MQIRNVLLKLILPVALALFVLLVLDAANPVTNLPTRDGGTYLYAGRLILRGELPYINIWDNKPPAIYYINALGLWLGRGRSHVSGCTISRRVS